MPKRKKTPVGVETTLLAACRRRCCLCVYLNDDWSVKAGQVAHIDQDPSNSALENLVWLCLEHHAEYDSTTSQSKGLTAGELVHYRDLLVEHYASEAAAASTEAEPGGPHPFEVVDRKLGLLWSIRPGIFDHLHESNPQVRYLIEDPVHFEEGCFEPLGEQRVSGVVLPPTCPRCNQEIYELGGRVMESRAAPSFYQGLYVDDLKKAVFRELRRIHKMGRELRGRIDCDSILLPERRSIL